ncbi:hypothetical protein ACFLT1_03655 [Bacteroidota bacterium]
MFSRETVRRWDSATVRRWDSATVRQCDGATVRRYDSATVRLCDGATVRLWDRSRCAWNSKGLGLPFHDAEILRYCSIFIIETKPD